jgi:hypothetical protein
VTSVEKSAAIEDKQAVCAARNCDGVLQRHLLQHLKSVQLLFAHLSKLTISVTAVQATERSLHEPEHYSIVQVLEKWLGRWRKLPEDTLTC